VTGFSRVDYPRKRKLSEAVRAQLSAFVVLLLAVAMVLFVWLLMRNSAWQRDEFEFRQMTHRVLSTLEQRRFVIEDSANAARAFLYGSDEVRNDEWISFFSGMRFEGRSSVQNVAYVLADTRSGELNPKIQFQFVRSGTQLQDGVGGAIVKQIEHDLFDSARSGKLGLSEPIRIPGDENGTILAICLPVYAKGAVPKDEASRMEALIGWAVVVFDAREMCAAAIKAETPGLDFECFEASGDAVLRLLFDRDQHRSLDPTGADAEYGKRRHYQVPSFEWGGRRWELRFSSLPMLEAASGQGTLWQLLAGGLLVAGMLFMTVWTSNARRELAEHIARIVRVAEEEYRTIFEQAPYGIFQIAPDGSLRRANSAFVRVFGFESFRSLLDEVRHVEQLHAHPEACRMWMAQTQKYGEAHDLELEGRRRNRSKFWFQLSLRAVRSETGALEYYEGILADISQRKSLESQLLQAQKMEAIGSLAGGVAHDFNNLLMVILGRCEMIQACPRDSAVVARDIDLIQQAAERAAGLTQQLLAFSRKRGSNPVAVDLNGIVTSMASLLQRLVGDGVELKLGLAPALKRVFADPVHLEQVVMNLAVNARDAMEGNGTLTIETLRADLSERFTRERLGTRPGPAAVLSISDTGCGMDAATSARIFEPFFTTKEPGKGTGLGLSIVYGVVKQCGGSIWVLSEQGKGTCFRICLPLATEENGESARLAPPGSEAGTETVLLVEDDELVRGLLRDTLECLGYTVLSARGIADAQELAREARDTIHALVTDVELPNGSGVQLARSLRRVQPDLAVLFISGSARPESSGNGDDELKGADFLQKPFSSEAIARALRKLLKLEPIAERT
jgi:PAS domain S-box-containing protein